MLRNSFGAIVGATWGSLFLIFTESTVASFVPFMVIAAIFITILFTLLRERLQPHASQVLKNQEKLLKKHLLDRKHAEGFHNRRYG